MNHPLKPLSSLAWTVAKRVRPPEWPSYRGVSKFVGTSPDDRVNVFVDPLLGLPGFKNAQFLLRDIPRILEINDQLFGKASGHSDVIVFALGGFTDGTGGADHLGCDFETGSAIEVCASFDQSLRVSALYEAELSECMMGGNLCGQNTGESLSRWCANEVGGHSLDDFATAPFWFQEGKHDWVNKTENTDQNPDSTGCGMAFISWLLSKGITLSQMAKAMVDLGERGTFADLFHKITKEKGSYAFSLFLTAVNSLEEGVTSDDPFGSKK